MQVREEHASSFNVSYSDIPFLSSDLNKVFKHLSEPTPGEFSAGEITGFMIYD